MAIEAAGEQHVALGSDMDGALHMDIDVEGLPSLVGPLWAAGVSTEAIERFLGGNAVALLRGSLTDS